MLLYFIAAFLIIGIFAYSREYFSDPTSWVFVGCIVYIIWVGGVVHNLLHGVPLVGYGRNDQGKQ